MKRFVSLLLILALASLSLLAGGCSAKEDAIVGTWRTTIDLSSTILEALGNDEPDIGKYMELDSFSFTLIATFREDNTFELAVDNEVHQKSMDKFLDATTKALIKYLEDWLKENGSGLTVEDYEKEIGMSIEDFVASRFSESDFPNIDIDIDTVTGEYTLDGTTLTIDGEYVCTIELHNDTLTFVEGPDSDDLFDVFKGVVWKKD